MERPSLWNVFGPMFSDMIIAYACGLTIAFLVVIGNPILIGNSVFKLPIHYIPELIGMFFLGSLLKRLSVVAQMDFLKGLIALVISEVVFIVGYGVFLGGTVLTQTIVAAIGFEINAPLFYGYLFRSRRLK